MPDFNYPGHPVAVATKRPDPPKPAPLTPSKDDRRAALEITAQAFQGGLLVNSFSAQMIIETAEQIASYLAVGKVAGK